LVAVELFSFRGKPIRPVRLSKETTASEAMSNSRESAGREQGGQLASAKVLMDTPQITELIKVKLRKASGRQGVVDIIKGEM
jgi:hypothetical protein